MLSWQFLLTKLAISIRSFSPCSAALWQFKFMNDMMKRNGSKSPRTVSMRFIEDLYVSDARVQITNDGATVGYCQRYREVTFDASESRKPRPLEVVPWRCSGIPGSKSLSSLWLTLPPHIRLSSMEVPNVRCAIFRTVFLRQLRARGIREVTSAIKRNDNRFYATVDSFLLMYAAIEYRLNLSTQNQEAT